MNSPITKQRVCSKIWGIDHNMNKKEETSAELYPAVVLKKFAKVCKKDIVQSKKE